MDTKLAQKIDQLLLCLAKKQAPAGGLLFKEAVFASRLDGTTKSLLRFEKLVSKLKQHITLAVLESSFEGRNLLKLLGVYLGSYVIFECESLTHKISWSDNFHVLTSEQTEADSAFWYTSLSLYIGGLVWQPMYVIKSFFELDEQAGGHKTYLCRQTASYIDQVERKLRSNGFFGNCASAADSSAADGVQNTHRVSNLVKDNSPNENSSNSHADQLSGDFGKLGDHNRVISLSASCISDQGLSVSQSGDHSTHDHELKTNAADAPATIQQPPKPDTVQEAKRQIEAQKVALTKDLAEFDAHEAVDKIKDAWTGVKSGSTNLVELGKKDISSHGTFLGLKDNTVKLLVFFISFLIGVLVFL